MNATELFLKEGKSAGVWYCEKCRTVHSAAQLAEQCCQNYKCTTCGADAGKHYLRCESCRDKEDQEKERQRFEAAEKLTTWEGWIFCDGQGSNEGYFENIEEFMDWLSDEYEEGIPEIKYVWACKANHFVNADVGDITERMNDVAWEDWDPETLNGLPELKAALDKFNEANKDVCSYSPDYTKAVLLNQQPSPK